MSLIGLGLLAKEILTMPTYTTGLLTMNIYQLLGVKELNWSLQGKQKENEKPKKDAKENS